MSSRRLLFSIATLFFSLGALSAQEKPALDRVWLQLKWYHQFQFAGYYIAQEKGYFAEEGLDVQFREGSPDVNLVDEVVSGKAQFGVHNSDLVIERVRGKPIVVLAAIFQHSPLVILVRADSQIEVPADFVDKTLMISTEMEGETYSIFSNEAVPLDRIHFVPHSWNLDDLISGRVDSLSAYSTNEMIQLRNRGIPVREIRPRTYGIDYYGDCLYTSERELKEHPKRVSSFIRATIRGWEYSMAHRQEAAQLIYTKYSQKKSVEDLVAEADAMEELILADLIPVGFMNPNRWAFIAASFASHGTIPQKYSLNGFIYTPNTNLIDSRILLYFLAILGSLLLIGLIYIVTLKTFNRRLSSLVLQRTQKLEELNSELEKEVSIRRVNEQQIGESLEEKKILLREIHHRVKNNLQVIMSLINLQLLEIRDDGPLDVRDMLGSIKNRVYSMALLHEHLYESTNLSSIDLDSYLQSLVAELVQIYRKSGVYINSVVDGGGLKLPLEQAIPVSLIIGELTSNSMKYAFPDRERGSLEIRIQGTETAFSILVADDGIGDANVGSPNKARNPGIGMSLVEALAQQLGGTVTVEIESGRRVCLDVHPRV